MADERQAETLADLRREIDRLDRVMHEALIARGQIIDRLIATKGTASSGSAFRPEREASMMRVLLGRHEGRLPLDAVEGLWRVIISTFTHVQAPFAVQADMSADPSAIQDSARFHFGFTVPFRAQAGPAAVVEAVARSRGDLGLVPIRAGQDGWWRSLVATEAPKIIARLPFVDRPDHPAALPLLVVAKSVSGEGLGAMVLHASPRGGDPEAARAALARIGGEIVAEAGDSWLVATPREVDAGEVAGRIGVPRLDVVGSHPAPVRLAARP